MVVGMVGMVLGNKVEDSRLVLDNSVALDMAHNMDRSCCS